MFKYIKEILSQISPSQRLWALVFLLFSISLISVGPKIVDSLTHSDEELIMITNRQRTQITELNTELAKLNSDLIKNKTECTNSAVEREREILDMIESLQRGLANRPNARMFESRQRESATGSSGRDYYVENGDTIRLARSEAPIQVEQVEDIRVPILMDGLNKIKSKIHTHINSKKPN